MKAEKLNFETGTLDILVGHLWSTVIGHFKRGHRLRLEVTDDDQILWCLFCKCPIVQGSADLMQRCGEKMKASDIEFEVILTTNQNHQ